MTRNDDFISQLEAYLEEYEGSTPLPEHVRGAIRAELPSTRQRPAWWPTRRFPEMNPMMKLSLAAAAVVVAALLGYNYLVAPNVGGPGIDDPAPTPTATPAALQPGPLDPGRYALDDPTRTPVRFAFTLPAGWTTRADFALFRGEEEASQVGLFSYVVTHVFDDACQGTLTEIGPTVDDLVRALEAQANSDPSSAADVTVGGYPAKRIEITIPAGLDLGMCNISGLQIWANPERTDYFAFNDEGEGGRISVYIVDVNGERAVIVAVQRPEASAADIAELDAVVASITFEP